MPRYVFPSAIAAILAALLAYTAVLSYVIEQAKDRDLRVWYVGQGDLGNLSGKMIEVVKVPIDSELTVATIMTIAVIAGLLTLFTLISINSRLQGKVLERTAELERDVAARRQAEQEVMDLNRDLEKRVNERTAQLEDAVVEQFCLNEQLGVRTSALEEANRSLETFSLAVSHDLRAPLHQIAAFSEILAEEHAACLNDDGKDLVQRIGRVCRRMDHLVDGMLSFSRIDRHLLQKEQVDTLALVNETLDELRVEQGNRRIDVTVGGLPPCFADPLLLKQVFANLLGNAFKYTRQKDVASIEVGVTSHGDTMAYYVRDNGAGFDMAYVDQLFGMFQRLHGSEFEGSGIGLATVKRIIDRHGGEIWAEGGPEKGATFFFTIGEQ
jgi:light-regulated signal transduction histidine kinase (bacteriophytochrome)